MIDCWKIIPGSHWFHFANQCKYRILSSNEDEEGCNFVYESDPELLTQTWPVGLMIMLLRHVEMNDLNQL